MDNALVIGLSRQLVLRRALDITANNIANMNTAGFKLDSAVMAEQRSREAYHAHGPRDVGFVHSPHVLRDFSSGAISKTGRDLDFALDGGGFFTVFDGDTALYTRDGRFTRDTEGRLVTQTGLAVLDDQDEEIVLPDGGAVDVGLNGAISVDGQPVAQLGLVRFADNSQLVKNGEGLFENQGPAPLREEAVVVRQGALESSNVNGVQEITRLIEIQRSYESVSRMISNVEELRRRAIERLGRAA